jgi:hypothetical protein
MLKPSTRGIRSLVLALASRSKTVFLKLGICIAPRHVFSGTVAQVPRFIMKFLSLAAGALLACHIVALPVEKRQYTDIDITILQFALTVRPFPIPLIRQADPLPSSSI